MHKNDPYFPESKIELDTGRAALLGQLDGTRYKGGTACSPITVADLPGTFTRERASQVLALDKAGSSATAEQPEVIDGTADEGRVTFDSLDTGAEQVESADEVPGTEAKQAGDADVPAGTGQIADADAVSSEQAAAPAPDEGTDGVAFDALPSRQDDAPAQAATNEEFLDLAT